MHHFRRIAVDWNAIFHLAYVKDATLGKLFIVSSFIVSELNSKIGVYACVTE